MRDGSSITRRTALGRIAGAAAGTLAAAAFAPRANAAARPNLLFILSDDQHFRALGAAGNPDIRTRRFKFIDYLKLGREELFDLETDPYEVHNLADSPHYQKTLKSLREQLMSWRAEMGDA